MDVFGALSYLFEPAGLVTDVLDRFGAWVYAMLFAIVFAETGLVVAPFLPGDSLLFASGAIAGAGRIDVWLVSAAFVAAAVAGDAVNYAVGRWFGTRLAAKFPRLVPARHLATSHAYFARYGGRTVLLARFVPIVRTFAPFVAGMSRMPLVRFWQFNVAGAFVWVAVFLGTGYFFGRIPWVESNLTLAMLLIVLVSLAPLAVKGIWHRRRRMAMGAVDSREVDDLDA